MFNKSGFKGTNTQRINEVQLKFQNEVQVLKSEISNKHSEILSLVTQLKSAQDQIKDKESSDKELEKLRAQLRTKEQEEREKQQDLQQQMLDLMKGYQTQITHLTQINSGVQNTNFQRPGSNRMIGSNKTDTRSSELKNFEKMFLNNSNAPPANKYPSSGVMIDLNNPSEKPFVKVSTANVPLNTNSLALDKSASLNAESQMVPVSASKLNNSTRKPPKPYMENSGGLGGTNGSTSRRLNEQLDEIENLNNKNAEEFPGSLKGTTNLSQIPEEVESLRNSSKFEEVNKSFENKNPNGSKESTLKFDKSIAEQTKGKKTLKIENFEGFPQIPEYEGIQEKYLNTIKTDNSEERFNKQYEDTFEASGTLLRNNPPDHLEGTTGTAGTAGTAKSIDFEELQK